MFIPLPCLSDLDAVSVASSAELYSQRMPSAASIHQLWIHHNQLRQGKQTEAAVINAMVKPQAHTHRNRHAAILRHHVFGTAVRVLALLMRSQPLAADPRRVADPQALSWHSALVRLEIPVIRPVGGRMRHFTEHCSATTITPGPNTLLLSAWHCFEDYAATQGPIRLFAQHSPETPLPLRLIVSGGSMSADWAILAPLTSTFGGAWIPLSPDPVQRGARVIAAGFAPTNDSNKTEEYAETPASRTLMYDPDCLVIAATGRPAQSDCVAKKGASGGAILGRTASGSVRVIGVISAGDGASVSYFHPTEGLVTRVRSLR